MKVLIVDDEKHVAEAIRLLIPWEEYGVTEVDNGAGRRAGRPPAR